MFIEYGKLSTKMYEITKPVGRSIDGDIEYYYEQLKGVKGLILEAGVGTGRMLIPFIQDGLQVEGVDLSAEMLKQCRVNMEKANIVGNIYKGDLTKLNLEKKYESIIMPTGSFCLLPRGIIKDVLKSLKNHLTSNGKLILDIELPSWFTPGEVLISNFPLSNNEGILFTSTAKEMDWHEQKVSYIHRYELIEDGIVKDTEISDFCLYWYGIREFEALLTTVGFTNISYTIGYGKNESASLVTFFAEK
ncbi:MULTISPECIES: class I SAM-dependent methyltransferase [Vagococcus]|uniref:Methyltransferase n=1 Tax=Vagococcus fluvialis bH819 TaxID=1255619 RepID=A0A1X6WMM3_9ENTE|nr:MULTISPECIES: class I SAM-dependent methyltransferase [Vagococcus]SLM85517.1 Methyltransferase [Vagococcus fluvialis bH819]HCM89485.1 class I SAM-dependent methyltransferase [Vagococcus sp.]